MKKELEAFVSRRVVLDTRSTWIYKGTIVKVTNYCSDLTQADVHDGNDSTTSKDLYIFDTRTTGLNSNRKKVFVSLDYIVSFSLLDDVKTF